MTALYFAQRPNSGPGWASKPLWGVAEETREGGGDWGNEKVEERKGGGGRSDGRSRAWLNVWTRSNEEGGHMYMGGWKRR